LRPWRRYGGSGGANECWTFIVAPIHLQFQTPCVTREVRDFHTEVAPSILRLPLLIRLFDAAETRVRCGFCEEPIPSLHQFRSWGCERRALDWKHVYLQTRIFHWL